MVAICYQNSVTIWCFQGDNHQWRTGIKALSPNGLFYFYRLKKQNVLPMVAECRVQDRSVRWCPSRWMVISSIVWANVSMSSSFSSCFFSLLKSVRRRFSLTFALRSECQFINRQSSAFMKTFNVKLPTMKRWHRCQCFNTKSIDTWVAICTTPALDVFLFNSSLIHISQY